MLKIEGALRRSDTTFDNISSLASPLALQKTLSAKGYLLSKLGKLILNGLILQSLSKKFRKKSTKKSLSKGLKTLPKILQKKRPVRVLNKKHPLS